MAIATAAIPIRQGQRTSGDLSARRSERRRKPPHGRPLREDDRHASHRTQSQYTTQEWQVSIVRIARAPLHLPGGVTGALGWLMEQAQRVFGQAFMYAFASAAEPTRPANAAQAPAAWGELDDPGVVAHEDRLGTPEQPTPPGAPRPAQRGGAPQMNTPERIASYEAFFQRHEHDIFGYLWRLTGDEQLAYDLRQETFLRAWNHYDQLLEYHQPVAWLFRVATNLAINQLRRRKAPVGAAAPLDLVGDPGASDPSWRLAENDLVRQTLMALPPRQRAALVMREVYGLSVEEVARTLGVTPAAVRMTLWRAREQFRTLYTRANGAPRWSPGGTRQRKAAASGSAGPLVVGDDGRTQPMAAYQRNDHAEPPDEDENFFADEQIITEQRTDADQPEGGDA